MQLQNIPYGLTIRSGRDASDFPLLSCLFVNEARTLTDITTRGAALGSIRRPAKRLIDFCCPFSFK